MIHQVFTVYDCKTEAYFLPFYSKTKGEAIRSFSDTINDPKHHMHMHLEDYTLFHLGEYDDNKGKHTSLPTPQSLGVAIEYLRADNFKNVAKLVSGDSK